MHGSNMYSVRLQRQQASNELDVHHRVTWTHIVGSEAFHSTVKEDPDTLVMATQSCSVQGIAAFGITLGGVAASSGQKAEASGGYEGRGGGGER